MQLTSTRKKANAITSNILKPQWNANPPYSNIRPWVEKAAEQCIQQRQTVVMLVPEDMSVGWFSKALESVDEVRIITDGRINFIEPSTGLEKKGNSKGSMLLIWRPFISPRRMFTTVAAGDAVSVVGTASQTMKPNLFYNKFFCGLGSIPLPKLHSIDSAVATYEGFSIRVHKYADGDANVQKMRFDLLPAYVCFNPHMGGQFFGNP